MAVKRHMTNSSTQYPLSDELADASRLIEFAQDLVQSEKASAHTISLALTLAAFTIDKIKREYQSATSMSQRITSPQGSHSGPQRMN